MINTCYQCNFIKWLVLLTTITLLMSFPAAFAGNTSDKDTLSGNQAHEKLLTEIEFPSAEECGACHADHYKEWSASRHAYAQLSPVFLAYQATLVTLTNGTLGDFCQRCHSQVGMFHSEPIIETNSHRSEVALEGITCIVCHRVAAAYGKISGRLPIIPGDIEQPVYGPRTGDELQRVLNSQTGKPPKVHRQANLLEQVKQPGFCARCHDVRLANGFRLEDAFSEFKQTASAKRGESCQDCHMGPIPGKPSAYPDAPAAVVRGVPTKPARRTNHMFAGPDSSLLHPGIFPISPEAKEFASISEWLSFDYKAGWGTKSFEDSQQDKQQFSGIWVDAEERIIAREIIDRQLALRDQAHDQGTTLLRNGYGLGEIKMTEQDHDLRFEIEVKNLTDGHSVPTGLIAERNVFLQVTVTDKVGTIIFRSGDLDPNGDVRDAHSLYVRDKIIPRDKQLFNLRSPFLVRTIHGGEREQLLPANYSFDPLIFIRPSPTPSLLMGGIRDLRLQKTNIEALSHRRAKYHVKHEQLTGKTPYTVNIKLVAGQLPPHLINAISAVGFEYGLSPRAIADKMIENYRVLWERNLVIN